LKVRNDATVMGAIKRIGFLKKKFSSPTEAASCTVTVGAIVRSAVIDSKEGQESTVVSLDIGNAFIQTKSGQLKA